MSSWRWPGRRSRKSFAATGRFVWHGEPIDTAITLTDFAAALAGDRSGLKVRLTGAPVKFAFEGNWSTRPTLQDRRHARGRRAIAARHVALGRPQAALRRRLRPLRAQGQDQRRRRHDRALHGQRRAGRQCRRRRAHLRHRRPADPAGHARRRELDLTPYVSTVRLLTGNERDWNRVPLVARRPDRLRSRPAAVGGAHHASRRAKLGRTADRRQSARRQAQRDDRRVAGIRRRPQGLDGARGLRSPAPNSSRNCNSPTSTSKTCLGDMFQFRRIEGRGDIAVAIDATGNSVLAMTRTLNGTANLIGRQGALVGFNVEQLLRRLERRPLSGTGDFRNGRTPFEKLTVDFKITRRHRHGRETSISKARRSGSGWPARPRSRRAISTCTGSPRSPGQHATTPRRRSNCRSWCRGRGTTRSCCRTPRP